MKKRVRAALLALAFVALVIVGIVVWSGSDGNSDYEASVHGNLPAVVTDADVLAWRQTPLGGQGQDLTGKDFAGVSKALMLTATYDTETTWPASGKLPAGFDPAQVLAAGRDPGLGVRRLHERGITGAGVAVAVIDKPIRQDHREFAGRFTYVEVDAKNPRIKTPHWHGMACASIFAGATTGVAPASQLYYIATPDVRSTRWANYAAAVEKVLAINAGLPREQQIRVVSLSDGPLPRDIGSAALTRFDDAVRRAEAAGVAVVNCNELNFAIRFGSAGAPPDRDRNDPDSYDPWLRATGVSQDELVLPADYRTTASNAGTDAYAYWGEGGRSWACPYLAGMIALGVQVKPDATPAELYQAVVATATRTTNGLLLVNPEAFIASLR